VRPVVVVVAAIGRGGFDRAEGDDLRPGAADQVNGRVQRHSDRRVQQHGEQENLEQCAAHQGRLLL
jgi:hypothetical protein